MCVSAIHENVYSSTVFGTEQETDSHYITLNNTLQIYNTVLIAYVIDL